MKSLCAFLFTLLAVSGHATIHYTYVYDDVYDAGEKFYDIDLDGDNDFQFEANIYYEYMVSWAKNTSHFAAEGVSGSIPKAYAKNAGAGTFHWDETYGYGELDRFYNTTKYLKVRFNDTGGNTYYGWFKLFHAGSYLYVESYAYNDVPDATLNPGEGEIGVGIPALQPEAFSLSCLTSGQIAFRNCDNYDQVQITTLDGKTLSVIPHPVSLQQYSIATTPGAMMIAYYRKDKLLLAKQYFVKE